MTKREQKAARKQKILEVKMIEAAEKLGWSITIDRNDGAWEFRQGSPAGEDFSFTAGGTDLESVIEDVKDYACHFDIDEHIEMWIGARGTAWPASLPPGSWSRTRSPSTRCYRSWLSPCRNWRKYDTVREGIPQGQ